MDETNELLREIRDLLAKREEQYQQYLADIKKTYAEQLKMAAAERTRALRISFAFLAVLMAVMLLILKS
jgi:hypothetical protein